MPRTLVKHLLPFVTAPGQSSIPPEFAPLYLSVYGLSTQLFCLPLLFHWPLKGRSIVFSLPPERSEAPLVYLIYIAIVQQNPE